MFNPRNIRLSILGVLIVSLVLMLRSYYLRIQHLEDQLQRCQIYKENLKSCKRTAHTATAKINKVISLLKSKGANKSISEKYLTVLSPDKSVETVTPAIKTKYSCEENFKNDFYPLPKGFDRENCTKQPIYDSTTIILLFPVTKDNRLPSILKTSLFLFRQVILILHVKDRGMLEKINITLPSNRVNKIFVSIGLTINSSNIKYKIVADYGTALNDATNLVKSPFVLVAPWIGRLDTSLDVERLIHVQETSGAFVVGGATKCVESGKWDRGCYQTPFKLYTLKYIAGYRLSQRECLFCEYVTSPFLVRTTVIKHYKFRKLTHGVFRDFFLQIKQDEELIVVCPDVMFYTAKENQSNAQLIHFAEQWDIRRIIEADNTVLWFGFRTGLKHTKSIGFSLLSKPGRPECGFSPTIAVTPDCRSNLVDALVFILAQCEKNNIFCEMSDGTVVGIIKFNNVLPWERDADLSILSSEFHKMKSLKNTFIKHGFKYTLVKDIAYSKDGKAQGGVIYLYAYGWLVEIYGCNPANFMTPIKPYTLVKMGNHWVAGPENPGRIARSRYGAGIYKHAEHWRALKHVNSFIPYEANGKFPKCIKPGHHSCLNQFKSDGDMELNDWL